MKVLFVRHAVAMEKEGFAGSDLERPLTMEGRKKAREAFKGLARLYPDVDLILTSEAVRARETAEILAGRIGKVEVVVTPTLNPGCDHRGLTRALAALPGRPERVVVVGHEPDFSRILAQVAAAGTLRVDVKKASCIEVDLNSLGKGELQALLPPAVLQRIGR